MNTTTISATDLKKNISDVLNRVYYEKIEAIVKRHDLPIAKIVPIQADSFINPSYLDILKTTQGAWDGKDWNKKRVNRNAIEISASEKRKKVW